MGPGQVGALGKCPSCPGSGPGLSGAGGCRLEPWRQETMEFADLLVLGEDQKVERNKNKFFYLLYIISK